MGLTKRFAVVIPLVSVLSVLALSAQGEEPNKGPNKGPPKAGPMRQGGPVARPGGPQGQRFARGSMPARNFGGHPYHGHLAWEGGRWHHAVRNGRDGWWWDVGGAWYFYPQMVEGPPTYVSDVEYA